MSQSRRIIASNLLRARPARADLQVAPSAPFANRIPHETIPLNLFVFRRSGLVVLYFFSVDDKQSNTIYLTLIQLVNHKKLSLN